MEIIWKAKATLPWVVVPTVVSPYEAVYPGDTVEVWSRDDKKTWFIPWGITMEPKWVNLVTDPIRVVNFTLWERVVRVITHNQGY